MSETHICVSTGLDGLNRLEFCDGSFSPSQDAERASIRTSRIFPLFATTDLDSPKVAGPKCIAIISHPEAHFFAGNLAPNVQAKMWFTLGLASLLVIGQNYSEVTEVVQQCQESATTIEIWEVDASGHIKSNLHKAPKQRLSFDLEDYLIPAPPTLKDLDIITHLREINHNLAEAAFKASIYNTNLLESIRGISEYLREIAAEIEFYAGEADQPSTVSDDEAASIASDKNLRHKRLNQSLDYIITINSSLVYLITQAFHGCSPILENNDCLIRQHSLFGVGCAQQAIQNSILYIESLFGKFSVPTAMEHLEIEKFAENIVNLIPLDDLRTPKLDQFIDDHDLLHEPDLLSPKLVSFSGRLGFGESAGSITCAPETLHAADSVRWSLLTLTHEMMHSHVEDLLISLFQIANPSELGERRFSDIAKTHISHYKENYDKISALDAIRGRLLLLLTAYETALEEAPSISAITESLQIKVPVLISPTPEPVLRDLLSSFKVLSEVMVHVLDLEYFYLGNKQRYVDSLWLSWATVPGVAESLDFYMLRTLASLGATEKGNIAEHRFKSSLTILKESFKRIKNHVESRSLIETAEALLEDPRFVSRLNLLFEPCCLMAELTIHFLFSEKIRISLESDDDLVTGDGEEKIYLMHSLETAGARITNPIAFLYDRLRRHLSFADRSETGDTEHDEEHRSAWIFFALASTKHPRT